MEFTIQFLFLMITGLEFLLKFHNASSHVFVLLFQPLDFLQQNNTLVLKFGDFSLQIIIFSTNHESVLLEGSNLPIYLIFVLVHNIHLNFLQLSFQVLNLLLASS